MMLPLVLLFIVAPIAELAVIIQVGQEIGALWTVAILIADSILGAVLLRSQGRAAWRRFNEAVRTGLVRAVLMRHLARRMLRAATTPRRGPRARHDYDVDGTATDVDPDALPHRNT